MAGNAKQKDVLREFTRKAREEIEEKEKHERNLECEAVKKTDPVDNKWILPSVSARIEEGSGDKKHKSKRKEKSESCLEWVEKPVVCASTEKSMKPERDSWMIEPPSFFPAISRKEIRESKQQQIEEDCPKMLSVLDKPGQTTKELNPYWKDGGTGLPDTDCTSNDITQKASTSRSSASSSAAPVGDGGYSWLMKAYQRAQEEAERDQRPLNDVIVERWGSMDKFNEIIREAKSKSGRYSGQQYSYRGQNRERNMENRRKDSHNMRTSSNTDRNREDNTRHKTWRKPSSDDEGKPVCQPHNKSNQNWRKNDVTTKDIKIIPPKVRSSPSSSSEMDDKEEIPAKPAPMPECVVLSDKEMNALGAKIVKAELMGNQKLVVELKKKLESARNAQQKNEEPGTSGSSEVVVLTRTDKKGFTRPLQQKYDSDMWGGRKGKKKDKIQTHDDAGKRARYFADDDRMSLKEMFEREKLGTAEDHNAVFSRLAAKGMETTNYEYDMDDVMTDRASRQMSEARIEQLEKQKAISEHWKTTKVLDSCLYCLENKEFPKHLIAAIGMKVYLGLPAHKSLTEGHCLIIPIQHTIASTFLDEDVWAEIQIFRKGLTKMFEEMEQDAVFFETNVNLKKHKHLVIQCVPIPKEVGDLSPIYFKKAILESETEWAQNKKLIDLCQKDVRRAVPKGLPYFSVDFGLQGGFAHVIEDERLFPSNFAQEIIGGMLDLEPQIWRKPPRDNFEEQRKKVLQFSDWWKPYDWTQRLKNE